METKKNGNRAYLIASEGKWITNLAGDMYPTKRVFLGCNDGAKNYKEITEDEYNEYLKRLEDAEEEELNQNYYDYETEF